MVVTSYFLTANECLGPLFTSMTGSPGITYTIGLAAGLALSLILSVLFIYFIGIKDKNTIKE